MKFVRTDCTIVIVGIWNVGIFQPDWVAKNVFDGRAIQLEVNVGMPPAIRYHCGRAMLIVSGDRLIGSLQEETNEASDEVQGLLVRILELLPHTPVSALGINLGFEEPAPDKELVQNFLAADNKRLTEFGATVRQTTIHRELMVEGDLLRLRETLEDNGAVKFHLNFHSDVPDPVAAAKVLQETTRRKRERGLELLRKVYNLTPEPANAQ